MERESTERIDKVELELAEMRQELARIGRALDKMEADAELIRQQQPVSGAVS